MNGCYFKCGALVALGLWLLGMPCRANEVSSSPRRPNIILIMTDDQGWGQTGYYNHSILKTPNLDAMATNGLRFDRFYAAAPVCSPTRASVLTGRSNDRTGVPTHGYALRLQEKTLPVALKAAGYRTAHFGKWHLNALRGPGVPVLKEVSTSTAVTWISDPRPASLLWVKTSPKKTFSFASSGETLLHLLRDQSRSVFVHHVPLCAQPSNHGCTAFVLNCSSTVFFAV